MKALTIPPSNRLHAALGLGLALLAGGSFTSAKAQNVITPTATASSRASSSTDVRNLTNSAGLLGSGPILSQTVSNNSSAVNMWESVAGTITTNWVKFDLGDKYELTGAAVWQFNQSGGTWRGAQSFGIYTSPDLATPITNYLGAFSLNQASGTVTEPAQMLSFAASGTRQVMFTFSNSFSPAAITNIGLSKVRFLGNSSGLSVVGPGGETTIVGATVTLIVTPSGGPPYGYQWRRAGANLVGVTGSTFVLANAQVADSGSYSAVVTNTWGSVTSLVANVTIVPEPTDNVVQPVDAIASSTAGEKTPPTPLLQDVHNLINGNGQQGTGTALERTAGNDGNAAGMWQGTDPSIVDTNWIVFDLGAPYNLTGAAVWNMNQVNLLLRAINQFAIFVSSVPESPLSHPASAYTVTNYVGTFSLNQGSGNPDAPVQLLRFNATNVVRVMFALSNCWSGLPIESEGLSEVRFLGNPLTVGILQSPQSAALFVGDPLQLTVTPSGGPPYGYQWWKNSTNRLAGAIFPALTLRNLQTADAGNYTVVVTNLAGSVTSSVAVVTVQAPTGITSGRIGQWKLDETSGTVASDATANADHGTVYNPPAGDAQWVPGQIGGAMAFSGRDNGSNYLVIPNYPKPLSTMSCSAWVWADGANPALSGSVIAGNWGTTNSGQFLLSLGAAGQLRLDLSQSTYGALQQVTLQETTFLPTNSWQHVAFIADGSTVHLYRNSIEVASASYDGTLLVPPVTFPGSEAMWNGTNVISVALSALVQGIGVGARLPDTGTIASTNFWQGKLDDLALWTRALTPNDITAIYAAGKAGQDATHAPDYPVTPPTILQSPQSVATYPSENPVFSVLAAGTQPFSYQWWENDTNLLASATNRQLALLSVQTDKAGFAYKVVVANSGGSVTSAPAFLTFLSPGPTTNDFSGGAYNTPNTAATWGTAPPSVTGALQLCNAIRQTNLVVFDRTAGASGHVVAQWMMYCTTGALGCSFSLLDTTYYGATGNPFAGQAAAPWNTNRWGFTNSLTIGFDVYNAYASPNFGNELTVCWGGRGTSGPNGNGPCSGILDGQQRMKIGCTPFSLNTGTNVPVKTEVTFVNGGANVSVWINSFNVLSNYFVAGLEPYESRVAFGAVTTSTRFFTNQISNLSVTYDTPGQAFPAPILVHTFVKEWLQTANQTPTRTFALPAPGQSFARVVAVLSMQNPPPGGVDYYDRVGDLFVWDDNGNQIEIIRFMSGYSTTWTWYVDLTEFQSVLRGNKQLQLYIGTLVPDGTPSDGYGYSMTADLYYYPGIPPLTPYKVQNLWNALPNYGVEYGLPSKPMDSEIEGVPGTFALPITLATDPGAQQFMWKSFVTGHGQGPNYQNAAEFLASWRILTVASTANALSYSNYIWKADNFRNPAGPESGTWTGSRAGWVPACVVNENGYGGWETNITPAITPGQPVTFTYAAMPWTNLSPVIGNSARYAFSSTLVSYRSTLLVPTIWPSDTVVVKTTTCSAPLPDLTGLVQSDISSITATQSPPVNTILPLGTNLATVTGWDTLGNLTNGLIKVVVVDTTPPAITQCVPAQTLAGGATLPDLRGLLVASDNCGFPLTVVQTPPPGALVTPALTSVLFQVDDGHGNTNTCSAPVTVRMPVIASGQVLPNLAFRLSFSGLSGQTYQVVMSTNVTLPLPNWTVVANGTFAATPATYTDDNATNSPARFYRVVSP